MPVAVAMVEVASASSLSTISTFVTCTSGLSNSSLAWIEKKGPCNCGFLGVKSLDVDCMVPFCQCLI